MENNTPIEDIEVIDRAMLDSEHAAKFDKPWLAQEADGTVHQFDTNDAACEFQRTWRQQHGLDPISGEMQGNVSVPIEQPQQTGEKLVRAVSDADLLAEINRRGMLQPLYGAIGAMHDHLDRTGALDERLTQYLAYRLRREEAAITGMPDSAARVANWQECIDQLDQLDREPLKVAHDSPSPGM